MFDMHYDLLTSAYVCYLKNDYTYFEEWCKYYNNDNVKGLVANLYFMSISEMREELHCDYYKEEVSVLEMFKISKKIVEDYLPNAEIIYSIEGCDYISGIGELRELYNSGLRAILLTWNEKNKYGSGIRSNIGLTKGGEKFLNEAINLGIAIDISHANEKTFLDILRIVKEKKRNGKKVLIYASHSNVKSICSRDRNLTIEQIISLKDIAIVAAFSNRNFVVNDKTASKSEQRRIYVEHISYLANIIGVDNVCVSTDNMDFCKETDKEYSEVNIYSYKEIRKELERDLSIKFNSSDIKKIMYDNAKNKIYNELIDI